MPKSKPIKKTRLWCFTNFDLDFDYEKYFIDLAAKGIVKYIACGRETCPNTGKEHDQGWVYFRAQRSSVKQVSHELGGCHVEKCRGSIDDNDAYCSKDGQLREWGTKPKQGERSDLADAAYEIHEGNRTVDEIAVDNPMAYHQYGRTLEKLEDIALRKRFRTWMTRGVWYWGKTGVGKSHKAFEGFDPETHYVFPNDGGWWDGYVGQETVIINEFRGGIAFSELLDLVDKWPKTVRRRGREPVPFLAKTVIITSSQPPEMVYHTVCNDVESIQQLYRRFQVDELIANSSANSGSEVVRR